MKSWTLQPKHRTLCGFPYCNQWGASGWKSSRLKFWWHYRDLQNYENYKIVHCHFSCGSHQWCHAMRIPVGGILDLLMPDSLRETSKILSGKWWKLDITCLPSQFQVFFRDIYTCYRWSIHDLTGDPAAGNPDSPDPNPPLIRPQPAFRWRTGPVKQGKTHENPSGNEGCPTYSNII